MRRAWMLLPLIVLTGCGWIEDEASAGAAKGSGTGASRSYAVGSFDQVALRGPDDAVVRTGPAASVRAEGDPQVLDGLEVAVVDGQLRLGRRKGRWWSGDAPRGRARFTVTLPSLTGAAVAGSGDLAIDRVSTSRFEASVAGSGDLAVGVLQSRTVELNVAGSGGLHVRGRADKASISIAGSGSVDASGLASRDADISIAGSGNAGLRASGTVAVSIMGSGNATVAGTTRCTVSHMGSGRADCHV